MKQTLIICTIAVVSLLPSCKRNGPSAPPINLIVLVDFSLSRDTSIVGWYKETISQSVLKPMGRNDRMIILPVDFNSKTSSEEIFKVNFSRNDYSNEYAGMQKDELEQQNHLDSVNSAVSQFRPVFDNARIRRARLKEGTDIFGGLSQCEKYSQPGYRNIVIIFSDMLEYTSKKMWNFEGHLNNEKDVEHYLSIAEKIDLQGMEVIVVTGAQNTMRPEKFSLVKSFWTKYLVQNHATVIDYSSGAVEKIEEQFTHK
jgi:hypothetical protein